MLGASVADRHMRGTVDGEFGARYEASIAICGDIPATSSVARE